MARRAHLAATLAALGFTSRAAAPHTPAPSASAEARPEAWSPPEGGVPSSGPAAQPSAIAAAGSNAGSASYLPSEPYVRSGTPNSQYGRHAAGPNGAVDWGVLADAMNADLIARNPGATVCIGGALVRALKAQGDGQPAEIPEGTSNPAGAIAWDTINAELGFLPQR